jgi:hypothetical protein
MQMPIFVIGCFSSLIAGVILLIVGEQVNVAMTNVALSAAKPFPLATVGVALIGVGLGVLLIVVFIDDILNMISDIFNS